MKELRIISGNLGGRVILSPQSSATHPMGAREKLALFNMIQNYLPGARVLDAFAGSGALGIEAISRGASEAVFVEKNAAAAQTIRQNLADLGIKGTVFQGDIVNFTSAEKFGVILADPPYDHFEIDKILPLVTLLDRGGVLVLSHPHAAPDLPSLICQKTRQYAAAHLSVYAKR